MPISIWLFTFVAADLGAHLLLPHFIDYYAACVPAHQFRIIVNHDPARTPAYPEGLREVENTLSQRNIKPIYWLEQFYPARKLKLKLQNTLDIPEEDWVLEVDVDEFCDFPGGSLTAFIRTMEEQGMTFAPGRLVDRFSDSGQPNQVASLGGRSIWEQYPRRCNFTRTQGFKTAKIPLHKAFWRTNPGNHRLIDSAVARVYFCGNPCRAGNDVKYRRPYAGDEDLFQLTPYAKPGNAQRYKTAWRPRGWPGAIVVDHFKWHSAVKASLTNRLAYYRGDADNGFKRRGNWEESERFLKQLEEGVDLRQAACQDDAGGRRRICGANTYHADTRRRAKL